MTGRAATTPLILDVDTGIDDSLALLYAVASPEADVVGGDVRVRQRRGPAGRDEHPRRARAGRSHRHRGGVGREVPLERPLETTPETHGPAGIGYAELPATDGARSAIATAST